MTKLHLDFETRSVANLKDVGSDVYAKHPTTDVLCMVWAIGDGPLKLWVYGSPLPNGLAAALERGDTVLAHNANFEFYIWNYVCVPKYGWPPLQISRFECTMLKGYAMGLPGKLENAAKATGLKLQKDMTGHRTMLTLCKPRNGPLETCEFCRGTGVAQFQDEGTCACVDWWEKEDFPEKYEKLYQYCKQDVSVERAFNRNILALKASEIKLWHLDQKINARGVYVDQPAIKSALKIVGLEKKRLDIDMRAATSNEVATCNANVALKNWINSFDIYRGAVYSSDGPPSKLKGEEGKLIWLKGDKKICQGVGKDKMLDMLELPRLPERVKRAIEIRQEAAKSSTAKLQKMIDGMSPDGRVRGCFQFLGAASTGRWAGRRIQLHNMPRPTIAQLEIEEIADALRYGTCINSTLSYIDMFHGPPMTRIADCMRAMLIAPPGKKLISCDFSSIESRALAWLAGEERKLNIYRGHGLIYEATACSIYGVTNLGDVTKEQRLIGKVAELACGYQGGVGAFQSLAKNYLVKIEDSKAEQIKTAWRLANPSIVQYWYDVERAAINATKYPGEKFYVGPRGRQVVFLKKGSFLFCRLPSGRAICYPYPKMARVKTPWGKMKDAVTYKGEENYQFVIKVAYGGLIAENITQAMCRDLLAEAMLRVDDAGYHIIMHVHDELINEEDINFGSLEEVESLMCIVPMWAKDMPIAAAGWTGERYRK